MGAPHSGELEISPIRTYGQAASLDAYLVNPQACSEATHSKTASKGKCTYRDNNLRDSGPRCYMEGIAECAGQCLTHAFKPAYYTNGADDLQGCFTFLVSVT